MAVGQELLDVPFPEMVAKLGVGIADAQWALDKNSIAVAEELASEDNAIDNFVIAFKENTEGQYEAQTSDTPVTLLQAGIAPTFYQFSEAVIEVEMDITTTDETENDVSVKAEAHGGWGLYGASISTEAKHNRKFGKEVHGSSTLKTTLVPVPTPEGFVPDRIPANTGDSGE